MEELEARHEITIELLLASSLHRYEGRPADGPLPPREVEERSMLELRAGLGVVGDRYFGAKAHSTASVTVMAVESVEALVSTLALTSALDPAATRRNIMLRGVDVDALARTTFGIDSGDGMVVFQGHRPANPCSWMDVTLAPGAFRALRGRGGVRCAPLTDGVLRVGPATLFTASPLGSAPAGDASQRPRGRTMED